MNKHDRAHYSNLSRYAQQIEAVYLSAVKEAAAIGALVTDFNPDRLFSFSDYPVTRKRIESLLESLRNGLQSVIVNGIQSEWTLANNKNNELCKQVFGKAFGHLTKEQEKRYLSTNETARDAFLKRKTAGLRLSDRVWNYTNQFKEEIELGLDVGIRGGKSADEISQDLRLFLKYPDKLFRRVRDEHGELQLSKNAAAFHPGQGVYRSSYKNARRVAVTECNIAYRTADHLRWQQMDFVVGILIEPSDTNHPVRDICDDLKGRYPKNFKWTGWHPHCRCHATPILKTEEEVAEDNNRIIQGNEVSPDSVNTVSSLPSNFTDWVKDNQERIERASSVPYFLEDNEALLSSSKHAYTGAKLGRAATKQAREALSDHTERTDFSPQQIENFADITKATGYDRGEPMTFEDADNGKANVYKDGDNCTACVLAHELRLRGYDITALPFNDNQVFSALSDDTRLAWLTVKGNTPEFTALIGGLEKDIIAKIEKQTQVIGSRYHLGWDMTEDLGHIITVERTKKGLVFYDPQQDSFFSLGEIISGMLEGSKLQLLRVDKLLINPRLLKSLTTTLE